MDNRVRHIKNGKLYEVINAEVVDASNGYEESEPFVLYRSLENKDEYYVRRYREFFDGRFARVLE